MDKIESTLTKALKAIARHETVDNYDGTANGDTIGTVCYDAYYVIHGLKARIKEQQTEIDMLQKEKEKSISYLANLFDKYEKTKIAKDSLEETIKDVRVETIKEFADILIEIGTKEGAYDYVSVFEIIKVAKEMGVLIDDR